MRKASIIFVMIFSLIYYCTPTIAVKVPEPPPYYINDIVPSNIVYMSKEGFNVTNCKVIGHENGFFKEVNNSKNKKVLIIKLDEFESSGSKDYVSLNCTNINATNPSDIIYEHKTIQITEFNKINGGIGLLLFSALMIWVIFHSQI